MGKSELLQRYLANVRLSVTDAYCTKCNPGWRETEFVPEFNWMYLCGWIGCILLLPLVQQ